MAGDIGTRPEAEASPAPLVATWVLGVTMTVPAAIALALVILSTGGAPQQGLADLPGVSPAPGWISALAQLLRDIALSVAAGLLLTAVVLLPATDGPLSTPARLLARAAGIATAAAVAAIVTQTIGTVGEITGAPSGQVVDPGLWGTFLTDTTPGRVLAGQAVLSVAAIAAAATARTLRRAAIALAFVLVAAALPALGAHAVNGAEHTVAVLGLALHLLAAVLWAGGLGGLVVLTAMNHPQLGTAVFRYSPLALACAVGIAVSGLLSAAVRLAGRADVLDSSYVTVLLAKLTAFILLVACGWAHRRHTVPHAPDAGESFPRRCFLRIIALECVVMGGAYGIAVGLSRTPPPPRALTGQQVGEDALGFALPAAPDPANLFGGLHLDAFGIAVAGVAGPLYLLGLRRLRRRGDTWPAGRTASFLLGLLVVLVVTCTGTGRYALALFSVHMAQHMTLNMVVPLLLVLGAPVTLSLRALPPQGRKVLLSLLRSRPAQVISHPLVSTGIFVLSLYALYFTPLFEIAMRNHWGHLLMQVHFLVSGWLFFALVIGPDPDPQRPPHLLRVPLLLVVMLAHTVFSVVLVFGGTVLGGGYFEQLTLPWATSALHDQALGGVLAWVVGEMIIVGVLVTLLLQWFNAAERADQAARRARDYGRTKQRSHRSGP